jgi:1,4-dihydroxy-6-naphthoate synthase
MLTVSISPCPNDTFSFFQYLVIANYEPYKIKFKDVQTLNEKAIAQDSDVIKISFATYPLIQDHYIILESGAALGEGCGPLLIAKNPIKLSDLPKLRIALPGKNTTANRLFEIFFPQAKNCLYTSYENIMVKIGKGEVDAGVIIHENRFTYQGKGFALIADLGDLWAQKYGALLPLGGIVAKRSLGSAKIKQISEQISKSVLWAMQNPQHKDLQSFIQGYAQEQELSVMQQHINLYVNQYSVNLGEKGRSAIKNLLLNSIDNSKPIFINDM